MRIKPFELNVHCVMNYQYAWFRRH
jgi:hypothetical protein